MSQPTEYLRKIWDELRTGTQKTQIVDSNGVNVDFATAAKQTDGSQKTQLVDASGNPLPTNGTPQRTEVEITRPSDIIGYTAGDAINTSTTTPIAFELPLASIASGGGGFLCNLKVETNIIAMASASLRFYFFKDTPSSITADNAAMTITYANSSKRCFYVDLTLDSLIAGSDTIFGEALALFYEYTTAATSLYFTVQTNTGFTPTSGGKIKITATLNKIA